MFGFNASGKNKKCLGKKGAIDLPAKGLRVKNASERE